MDRQRASRQEGAALMRIVDLLLVLVSLAELACSRSPAVRTFVLWVLRYAEAVARDFVSVGQVLPHDTRLASMPDEPADGYPTEAIRLAISLRALAHQLAEQASLTHVMCGEGCAVTQAPSLGWMPAMRRVLETLSMAAAFACLTPHPAPDTS